MPLLPATHGNGGARVLATSKKRPRPENKFHEEGDVMRPSVKAWS